MRLSFAIGVLAFSLAGCASRPNGGHYACNATVVKREIAADLAAHFQFIIVNSSTPPCTASATMLHVSFGPTPRSANVLAPEGWTASLVLCEGRFTEVCGVEWRHASGVQPGAELGGFELSLPSPEGRAFEVRWEIELDDGVLIFSEGVSGGVS